MTQNTKTLKGCDIAPMIYKLCSHVTKQPDGIVEASYKFAMHYLSKSPSPQILDEFVIVEQIKKKLVKHGRPKDALAFAELYRKLQNSNALKNRCNVLTLLASLYEGNAQRNGFTLFTNEFMRISGDLPEISLHPKDIIMTKPIQTENVVAEALKTETELENQKMMLNAEMDKVAEGKSRVSHVASLFAKKAELEKKIVTWSHFKEEKKQTVSIRQVCESEPCIVDSVVQKEILRDVVYVVQGIAGKHVVLKQGAIGFEVDVKDTVRNSDKMLILRFVEMGWMLTKINKFCESHGARKTSGLILQSFISVIQEQLFEYYRILALVQSQLQNEVEENGERCLPLTLQRLLIVFLEPFLKLQVLSSVVDSCSDVKGGALASVLFSYLQHGNKEIHEVVKCLLVATVQPLYRMISDWLFKGELEDIYEEFFVTANMTYPDNNMWQERYSLNKVMIPSFLSLDQAKKILSTGKAINFLRQVCKDHSFVKDSELLKKKHDEKTVESLFMKENDGEFNLILEKNYQKTSCLVLSVLHKDYKLMAHFHAMRNYLLLGQGDFIRHIMDLLEPNLGRPANTLYHHILSGIVKSAIRATNAQYHDPEILQRLEGRLMESSVGDTGWDIFTLNYKIDGPIATVFTPSCMTSYLRLFKCLWRAKHMEYLLAKIYQSRGMHGKIQLKIPAVMGVAQKCNVILAQMIHFVQQMQYYNAFEVMECCWADLLQKIKSARDLDEVIAAHETFLDTLLNRSLLNEESMALQIQLKAIYNLIVQFQKMQDKFWSSAQEMVNVGNEQEDIVHLNTLKGTWGITQEQTSKHHSLMEMFLRVVIPKVKAELKILFCGFEGMVQKFLLMLNDHQDQNLRFLSFRLDFNEHYKNRNTQLHSSLTFLHRRQSARFI